MVWKRLALTLLVVVGVGVAAVGAGVGVVVVVKDLQKRAFLDKEWYHTCHLDVVGVIGRGIGINKSIDTGIGEGKGISTREGKGIREISSVTWVTLIKALGLISIITKATPLLLEKALRLKAGGRFTLVVGTVSQVVLSLV